MMIRATFTFSFAAMAFAVGVAASAPLPQEKGNAPFAVLAGEWKINYTNDAVRTYVIEKDGRVSGVADEERLKGQIKRTDGIMILIFEGDGKLERLTLGSDGRLFVEHYPSAGDYPEKKAPIIGIGVKQK
jgi:hypothetical protein